MSSTFTDLQEERQEVMHALLELDCIPSGMELFSAANEDQWNIIKKVIDDCDYYILILAGRYGSIAEDGLSYTEKEYRYALTSKKPTIAFLHKNPGDITASKSELTDEGRQKLLEFREFVSSNKLIKHWDSAQTLGSVVSRSLIQLIKNTPAVGWVRADKLADKDLMEELIRVKKENDYLTKELELSKISAPSGTEDLAQGEDTHTIKFVIKTKKQSEFSKSWVNSASYPHEHKFNWNEIFAAIGPILLNEATEGALRCAFDDWLYSRLIDELKKIEALKKKRVTAVRVHEEDFQTIKVQLRALKLIQKSEKQRSVKDTNSYWCLTRYGDQVMTNLRAIRKNVASTE